MPGRRSRHRMHCRECRRQGNHYRFTLRMAPRHYKRPIKCPHGHTDVLDYETTYQRVQAKRGPACRCYGVPHPHRPGTHRMCETHPMAGVPLTEYEERDWLHILQNPRRTAYQ